MKSKAQIPTQKISETKYPLESSKNSGNTQSYCFNDQRPQTAQIKTIQSQANFHTLGVTNPISGAKVHQLMKIIHVNQKSSQKLLDPGKKDGEEKEYKWDSKFTIKIYNDEKEDPRISIYIYIATGAEEKVFKQWKQSVATAWNNRFAVKSENKTYPIFVRISKVSSEEKKKHYDVENIKQEKSIGKRGLFGTESMTKWGESDPQDIPHEVGHMLGNKDEYGTVDGRDFSKTYNPLDPDTHSIMHKGDEPPRINHFSLVFQQIQNSGILKHPQLIKYIKPKTGSRMQPIRASRAALIRPSERESSSSTKSSSLSRSKSSSSSPVRSKIHRETSPSKAENNTMVQVLHDKRVAKITQYVMDNIETIPKVIETLFYKFPNWREDPVLSEKILNEIGI